MNKKSIKEADLSPADAKELRQLKKYLTMKATKRGRKYLATQKFWKGYQGLST